MCALAGLWVFALAYAFFSYPGGKSIFPSNGTYQAYNLVRHLANGDGPISDFMAYTGFGSAYVNYLAATLMGGKVGDYMAGGAIFAVLAMTGFSGLVWWALGCPPRMLPGVILFIGSLAIATLVNFYLIPILDAIPLLKRNAIGMFAPGNSNLNIRSMAGFLAFFVVMMGVRREYGRSAAAWIVGAGFLTAMISFWGNDYGFVSAILSIMAVLFGLFFCGVRRPGLAAATYLVSIAISWCLLAWALFDFEIGAWYQLSILDPIRNQQPFFFSYPPIAVNNSDIVTSPYFLLGLVGGGTLLFLLLRARGDFHSTRRMLGLCLVWAALFVGGAATNAGSYLSEYYWTPLRYFLTILAAFLAIRGLASLARDGRGHALSRSARLGLACVRGAGVFVIIWAHGVVLFEIYLQPPVSMPAYEAEHFGMPLEDMYRKALGATAETRAAMAALPPHERFLSTYSSILDDAAGSFNATGTDYIIHALGPTMLNRWVQAVRQRKAARVTTARLDFLVYEPWLRRQVWPFYKALFETHRIETITPYNIVWRPRATPPTMPQTSFDCIVTRHGNDAVKLTIRDRGGRRGDVVWVDLAIDYSTKLEKPDLLPLGHRYLLTGRESDSIQRRLRQVQLPFGDDVLLIVSDFGMPSQGPHAIGLMHEIGRPSSFDLAIRPLGRAALSVAGCTATAVVALEDASSVDDMEATAVPLPGGQLRLDDLPVDADLRATQWLRLGDAWFIVVKSTAEETVVTTTSATPLPSGRHVFKRYRQ